MVLRFSRTTYKSVFFRPVFQLEPLFHNQPPLFDTTSFTYKYRLACGYKTMLARYKKTNLRISCYLGIVSVKFILFSKKPVYKKQRIKNDKKNLALYFGFRKTSSILFNFSSIYTLVCLLNLQVQIKLKTIFSYLFVQLARTNRFLNNSFLCLL